MIVPRYVPGDWFAVVTDGTVVLLPPDTSDSVVEEMWSSLREHPDLADHLGVLTRERITSLPPFALVSVAAGLVRVIVRGEVEVEVDGERGSRVLTAPDVSTWSEAVVQGARAVRVRSAAAAGSGAAGGSADAGLAVLSGVVRADQVQVSLRADEEAGAPAPEAPAAEAPAAQAPAPATRASEVPAPAAPAAQALAAQVPVNEAPATEAPATAGPVVAVPVASAPSTPPVPSPWSPVVRQPETDPTEMTVAREPRKEVPTATPAPRADEQHAPAPSPAPVGTAGRRARRETDPAAPPIGPAVAAPSTPVVTAVGGLGTDPDDDHDGLTVLSSDVVALRRQLPEWAGDAVPGPLAVPAAQAGPPAKILLSSGLVVALNRPVLLGRAPQVSRVTNSQLPRLVTVSSPNQDISRTHAEVRQEGEDVVVTDLRSTNGVLLLRQGTGPQRLHPGEPTVVEPGVVVDLGEGVTFVVERGT